MTRFSQRWEHFWFRTGPPHLLAIFRIAFGLFLLIYFGMQLPHTALLYSREGLHLPMFAPDSWATVIFAPPSQATALFLFVIFLAFLTFFTIGFLTRVSMATVLLLYIYYWILSLFQFGTSFDRLFIFTLLVLTFSGCGKTLSLDMKIGRGSWFAWEPISILPQRLLAVQISATYLGVGWQKLVLPGWQTGKVLAYGFLGRWATPPAWWIARMNLPVEVYDWMVWIIKAFELSIPFGLWVRKWQWWFFAGGAIFHIAIAILLAIWWFLPLIPAYILFLSPEDVASYVTKFSGVSRGPGGAPVPALTLERVRRAR